MDLIRQKQEGRVIQLDVERQVKDIKDNKENISFKFKDNSSVLLRDNKNKKNTNFVIHDVLKQAREDVSPSNFQE